MFAHKTFVALLLVAFSWNAGTAQVKITASTFSSIEARAMGPGTMSGRITAIEGVNSEPRTLYIGTAGGGVWKTTNACASFKPIFDKYCQSIGAIAIDQKQPKTVYVGTGESNMRNTVSIGVGMYKSTDGGENWVKIGLDSTEHISKILIDPSNSNVIYVAAPGPLWSDSPHRGLYKSVDGGKTWDKVLYIDAKTGVADIAIDPSATNIIYATTWEFRRTPFSFHSGGKGSAIYKSEDAGKNWRKLTKGLPSGEFGRVAIALAPSAPENLLAIVESKNTGLFISSDRGETWKAQSATLNVTARPFYFSTLVFDPTNHRRVYRPALNFSYSDDGGYSFNDASSDGGWVHSDHHALWINPNYTDQMFLGTDGGVYVSNDRGATFTFCHNLPVGQFYHVAVDERTPYQIYGGLQDNGSWVGPSEKPGGVGNGDWKLLYFGDGFWTVPDKLDSNIVYAEYQGGNMARIDLRSFKAYPIQPQATKKEEPLRWNWNTPIVLGSNNPKNLYVGAQYLFKSVDQGRNWKRISPDLTTNDKRKQNQEDSGGLSPDNTSAENHCTIFAIAESPHDDQVIWVGTDDGNIQYTRNGGKDWVNVTPNVLAAGAPAYAWVSSIELSQHDINTIFITLDHHMFGDHNTYLLKSTNHGATWNLIKHKDFTGFAHKIKSDHINKNLLFLGTEMGLFASLDGGTEWFRMKNKIPEYALVRDIQIHPTLPALIVGTHGRGIFIIDDITPFRKMSQEIAAQDVVVFDIQDFELSDGKYGGGSPYYTGWTAPNPPFHQYFQFYLKEKILTGETSLEILDENGKLVQRLPFETKKGINRIHWNMRMKPPKIAEGGTKLDVGGFIAPMVMPGTYTAKLTLGDRLFTKSFKCVHIDQPTFTLDDRTVQYETAMKYYQMHEMLAKLTDEIISIQKELNDDQSKIEGAKDKKAFTTYKDSLEKLRTSLLASKNKSIFADEKKLREEITEAYTNVVGAQVRPSNMLIERANWLHEKLQEKKNEFQLLRKQHEPSITKIRKKHNLLKEIKS